MQTMSETLSAPLPASINATVDTVPDTLNIQGVIALTSRLAQLLSEEVQLLGDMKVAKIEELQKEKLFLVKALDAQRILVDKHPNVLETIPSRDKKDLQEVVEIFNHILEENHRKLLLAKQVNQRIVKAISDTVKQQTHKRVYNRKGVTGLNPYETLPVTLNKKI